MGFSNLSFDRKIEVAKNITLFITWVPIFLIGIKDMATITSNLKILYRESKMTDYPIKYRPDIDEVMKIPDEELESNEEKNLEVL